MNLMGFLLLNWRVGVGVFTFAGRRARQARPFTNEIVSQIVLLDFVVDFARCLSWTRNLLKQNDGH